jgi:AhpD family alkylhydroperoxidase
VTETAPAEEAQRPRVGPASREEVGALNALLLRIASRAAKTAGPPKLFRTMARNRGLFRRWLLFAGALMPGGKLPRADTELVILRVSHLTGCPYEADHHVPMALRAGLEQDQIDAVTKELGQFGWTPRQLPILTAVDELHSSRRISDPTFGALRTELSDRDLVELCMLAGHYEMIAGLINSLGIERDRHR